MKRALAALGLLLIGCDDGVDLAGVYRVDSALRSTTSCTADMPVTDPPAFLKFYKTKFFIGDEVWTYKSCTDQAAMMCSDFEVLGNALPDQLDNGWRGTSWSASWFASNGNCVLGFHEQIATRMGAMLVIDSKDHTETVMMTTQDKCTADEAEARGAGTPCTGAEKLEATKI